MNRQPGWPQQQPQIQPQPQQAKFQNFNLISRDELHQLVREGKSDAQIASLYGVTVNQVNQKRRLMNLIAGQMSQTEFAEVVQLAESVKRLPMEAIQEIKSVVSRYLPS